MGRLDRTRSARRAVIYEAETRKAFSKAVPLKTLVIHCYDPRARDIPNAVADLLGNEVFPGEILHDPAGRRVTSATTILPIVVAGGRAIDALALRSITVAQHLFGIKNVFVVHHSHCGATSFTASGIIKAFEHEHDADISRLYDWRRYLHLGLRAIAAARRRAHPHARGDAATCQSLRLLLRHRHRAADRGGQTRPRA